MPVLTNRQRQVVKRSTLSRESTSINTQKKKRGVYTKDEVDALITPTIAREALVTNNNEIVLANGANTGIVLHRSYITITGPTGTFSVEGIVPDYINGQRLLLINLTSQVMVIAHESVAESAAINRIHCYTGADITLAARKSAAEFVYDGTMSRWICYRAD